MAKNLSAIRAIVRQFLDDEFVPGSSQDFKPDALDLYIADCLAEISERRPYEVKEVLTTLANSKELDISSIEDLLRIDKLEYPVGSTPRDFRNVIEVDADTIEIDTSLTPIVGGSGTLTGTVTFATGSATITGSGTSFSDDLEVNYLIKKSGGTRWYRIYSIASATELTLAEPVRSSDNGADTENLTEYCYEAVYLYCEKLHQLTESSSTLTPQIEKLLVDGAVAKAALSWINQVRKQVTEAIARIADVNTSIDSMSARITQAVADLTSGRDLGFNKVYVGGRPLDDYAKFASGELSQANTYLGQSQGYLRELTSRLSVAGVISSYQTWANNKLILYKQDLKRLAKSRTYTTHPKS